MSGGIELTAIDHVVLTVADVQATCEFWTRVLGAERRTFGDGRLALQVGAQKVNVHPAGPEPFDPNALHATPGSTDICLLTSTPLDEVIAHLLAEGVTLVGAPGLRSGATTPIVSVYVHDPDENLVEIACPVPRDAASPSAATRAARDELAAAHDDGSGHATHIGEVRRGFWLDQGPPSDDTQRLWAPWRFSYVSGGTPIEGCPFCVIPARGPERDRESLLLHRGEHAYVIFNAYPYNPGHLMVIPYGHVADVEDLELPAANEMWLLARRAVPLLKEQLGCQGVNLGMNLGSAAGAGIAPHQHLHVVPRWGGDTNFISVVGGARVMPQALTEIYDLLAPAFTEP